MQGLVWLQQRAVLGPLQWVTPLQPPLGFPRPSPAPRTEAGAGPGAKRPCLEGGRTSRWRAGGPLPAGGWRDSGGSVVAQLLV